MNNKKLEILKSYGYKTKEDFIKEVKESNNKGAKSILDYMLNEANEEDFDNLLATFIRGEDLEKKRDTYYLKYKEKTIAEYKEDNKEEVEEEFRKIAAVMAMGKDYELREDENKTYILEIEKSMEDKLKDGEPIDEYDMEDLVWHNEVYREEHGDSRWTRSITSVVEVDGDTYAIDWEKGLTEMQPNAFDNQPYKCRIKEEEVVVIKKVIERV